MVISSYTAVIEKRGNVIILQEGSGRFWVAST